LGGEHFIRFIKVFPCINSNSTFELELFVKKSSPRVEVPGMSFNLMVRITRPFCDLSGAIRQWALKCERMAVYEHEGSRTEKIHIHAILIGCSVSKERLKQLALPMIREHGSGNEFWSFKEKDKRTKQPISATTAPGAIIYMTKGKHDPMYYLGYELEYLTALKDQWQEKAEPESREVQLCKAFEQDAIWELYLESPDVFEPGSTMVISSRYVELVAFKARSWAFKLHHCVWSVRTATDAKMVFLTYCMRYGLIIPKEVKLW